MKLVEEIKIIKKENRMKKIPAVGVAAACCSCCCCCTAELKK